MRPPHIIRHNAASERPAHVIIVDTETLVDGEGIPRLRLGVASYIHRGRKGRWSAGTQLRFRYADTFWDWVQEHSKAKRKLYVLAHNTGFDMPVLGMFPQLEGRGYTLTKAILADPPTYLSWSGASGGTIAILDSTNYYRQALSTLDGIAGLPKLTMPDVTDSDDVWYTYCARDVAVLQAAMLAWWGFVADADLGNAAISAAGQAFAAYRHRFMSHPIHIHSIEPILDLERASYYGGRTEALRLGRIAGAIHVLDVNSLYPAVMADGVYPTHYLRAYTACSPARLAALVAANWCVADVDIDTPEPAYPVRYGGRLMFPVGAYRTSLCGAELIHALAHGRITSVHHVAVYDSHQIFAAYVADMYQRRLDYRAAGNQPYEHLSKLLLNSLYGKFGQRGYYWREVSADDVPEDIWVDATYAADGTEVQYRMVGQLVQRLDREGESADSFPAIAAGVAAAARMRLWELMQMVPAGHLYYVDTDSLWVSDVGRAALESQVDSQRLGSLKVEATHDWMHIRGLKDYETPAGVKVKGIRKSATELEAGLYQQEQWRGWAGMIRDRDTERVLITPIVKRLGRNYTKGNVSPSGVVTPYGLSL